MLWHAFWNYLISFPYGLCAYAMLAAGITLSAVVLSCLGNSRQTPYWHGVCIFCAIVPFLLYFLLADWITFLAVRNLTAFFLTFMGVLLAVGVPTLLGVLYLCFGPGSKSEV